MNIKNKSFYQKGNSDGEGILYLIGFALFIAVVLWFFGFNYHGTSEGTVDYNDCREIIQLQPNNWHTYFGTFIGYTQKTNSGKVMGGEFVRIVNDSSLFGNSHTCAKAYIYNKKQENICTDPTHPYLTSDDMCSTYQY